MRNVIFNYNLFKEAIVCFHSIKGKEFYKPFPTFEMNSQRLFGYLLFDFKLTTDWEFDDFVIEKSIEVYHNIDDGIGQECVKSFISPVSMPNWVKNRHKNPHLFLLGLSAVCSFCLDRPVFSPKNSQLIAEENQVTIRSYFDEHVSNLKSIENLKVVIKTSEGKEIKGTFSKHLGKMEGRDQEWPLFITFDDGKFIAIYIDDNTTLGEIQQNDITMDIDCIYVVKHPDLRGFSLLHPVSVRGPGCVAWDVHADVLNEWKKRLENTLETVSELKFEKKKGLDYKKTMQAMRLIQLAHQNHKEDFDLSYSFLVAAIEAIAQIAISTKDMRKERQHEKHEEWKKLTEENPEIRELFGEYDKMRKNQKYLADRFAKFIFDYCPVTEWEVIDHQELQYGFSDKNPFKFNYDILRSHSEIKPEYFNQKYLKEKIVKETYNYRSKFFHAGTSLPHQNPQSDSTNRFFEEVVNIKESKKQAAKLKKEKRNRISAEENEKTKLYLINHDLMKNIARKAISKFLIETVKK